MSSSLVTEILSSAGKLEKEELGNKITSLSGSIDNFKIQVQEILLKRYVDFVPLAKRSENLENKAMKFTGELQTIKNLIQNELVGQIQESADEFKVINTQLEVTEATLDVVKTLVEMHDTLSQCKTSIKCNDFLEAVLSLEKVKQMKAALQTSWTGRLKLMDGLEQEYLLQCESLKYEMEEIWKEYVAWSIEESSEGGEINKGKSVRLTISETGERLSCLTKAMHSMLHLGAVLKRFTSRFNEHIIQPIVTQNAEVRALDCEKAAGIMLNVSMNGGSVKEKPLPRDVLDRLTIVFNFLHEAFGEVIVSKSEGAEIGLMHHLGGMFYEDFCQVLIQECLSKAIPCHRKDLQSYDKVVEATTQFYEMLRTIGFASESNDSLIRYAQNVDTLFANKMCRDLLCKAKKIMMEDLYHSVAAQLSYESCCNTTNTSTMRETSCIKQDQKPFEEEVSFKAAVKQERHALSSEENHSQNNLMKFPKCQISTSVQKLVDMLYTMMEEASSSSPQCAERLFTTARNVVHLYCDMMPCYHKDSLESLPQQSGNHSLVWPIVHQREVPQPKITCVFLVLPALFHNNCMFVAHHLMTLGHQFRSKLPLPFNANTVTFLDLVVKVRKLGVEVFLSQMRIQRKQLIGILAEAGDFRNIVGETRFMSLVEKAIKQCLLQLEHLWKVWRGILPHNVCRKSLGTLINTLIEEIITRVTTLEDLPAVNATNLIAALEVIKERAPGLFEFSDPNSAIVELQRYVPKWMKFQELLLILAATMQDILDRWASGKGPLAQEFTVDEAKQLIRALFQNTDHRAAVLAKIR